ncbi:thermonuclease family protein [Nostoc sp. FACHB-145]|uniref:thermonuclease family protein n=1 Tax=Nostoc sp. FACHB-145 TaxID=2692836 RepID=UPI001688D507|nr:thermonuclease family protein [Nostoc sp. FACHB-145]MBD2473340.1 thermonuclease family protein [Nostoc sp. FACHB-145]
MNPLQKTATILLAITLISSTIWIVRSMNNSPAFPEQWAVMEVTDAQTMTVRQTDGHQMQVRLCGIDTPEQALSKQATEKLRSLVGTNDRQVTVIPVTKDNQGLTIAEVMAYGKDGIEVSFQEELLKSGLVKTHQSGVECPNQIAFENAQRLAIASKTGIWGQLK